MEATVDPGTGALLHVIVASDQPAEIVATDPPAGLGSDTRRRRVSDWTSVMAPTSNVTYDR
jgi:hypothetical protein